MRSVPVDSWKMKAETPFNFILFLILTAVEKNKVCRRHELLMLNSCRQVEEPEKCYFETVRIIYVAQPLGVRGYGSGIVVAQGFVLHI